MRTHYPGHLKAFDYLGLYRYFLTFCTDNRRRLFIEPSIVELARVQIFRAAAQDRFAIVAYCFMPDHLHLLVEGLDDSSDGRAFIKRAKQYSGFYFSKETGRKLWQRYGYERTLRNDEATLDVAKYILSNPLRAGLVTEVKDYPYLGSETHTVEEILDALMDRSSA